MDPALLFSVRNRAQCADAIIAVLQDTLQLREKLFVDLNEEHLCDDDPATIVANARQVVTLVTNMSASFANQYFTAYVSGYGGKKQWKASHGRLLYAAWRIGFACDRVAENDTTEVQEVIRHSRRGVAKTMAFVHATCKQLQRVIATDGSRRQYPAIPSLADLESAIVSSLRVPSRA